MNNLLGSHQQSKSQQKQYDLQKILAQRKGGNRTFYLVKWLGYPNSQNTWQPYCNLKNAPQKIRQWKKEKKKRQQKNRIKQQQKNKRSLSVTSTIYSYPQSYNSNKMEKSIVEKSKSIKKMNKSNLTSQHTIKQQTKKLKNKSEITQQKQSKEQRIIQMKSAKTKENLQPEKNKQIIVIKIQDSSDQQDIHYSQQEIVEEDSVSYTPSDEDSHSQILDQPDDFLNINNKQVNKQKPNPQADIMKSIFAQSIESVRDMNINEGAYMQFFEKDPQLIPQVGLMQKILGQQGNLNIAVQKIQSTKIFYQRIAKLKSISQIEDKLQCTAITDKGSTLSNISYQSIKTLRPDLIQNFFRLKQ